MSCFFNRIIKILASFITATLPCNILRFYTAVKITIFSVEKFQLAHNILEQKEKKKRERERTVKTPVNLSITIQLYRSRAQGDTNLTAALF